MTKPLQKIYLCSSINKLGLCININSRADILLENEVHGIRITWRGIIKGSKNSQVPVQAVESETLGWIQEPEIFQAHYVIWKHTMF